MTIWRIGQECILECDGEKFFARIAFASENGKSLMLSFNALVAGHLGAMPLLYDGDDIFVSIVNGTIARLHPVPENWHGVEK